MHIGLTITSNPKQIQGFSQKWYMVSPYHIEPIIYL